MAAFVDAVRIEVRGGDGGAGVASFQKRKGKPKGKPTGGSGGTGGDVRLKADPGVGSLLRYDRHPHWSGENGTHGEGELRHGRRGEDLVLLVPLGTMVYAEDGTRLADLVEAGQEILVARGGRGGRGNASFVSPARRAPSFAEQGEYGEAHRLSLELKLVADAALIGYPNAGKSTLISRVSAAHPKIADYPFTTLEPHLGVVTIDDREFVLADIPGLIEGAASGKGLGHEFLRHTERARVLVLLLDPSSLQADSPEQQYAVLTAELAAHSPELMAAPRLVAMGKADLVVNDDEAARVAAEIGVPMLRVSAVTGEGIEDLLHAVADLADAAERTAPDREGFILHQPLADGYSVRRAEDGWIVEGRAAARAVNLDDLTVPEAAQFAARRLARIGVDDALRRAGARPGDDVHIGTLVFTYDPDLAEEGE